MGFCRAIFAALALVLAIKVQQHWHPQIQHVPSNLLNVAAGLANDLGVLNQISNFHPVQNLPRIQRARHRSNRILASTITFSGESGEHAKAIHQETLHVPGSLDPEVSIPVLIGYPPKWPELSADQRKEIPVVIYFHGGGWFCGNVTPDATFYDLSFHTGAVVAMVDYRLSPEHYIVEILQDCFDATAYLFHNAAALGIAEDRFSIAGASAGGFLAAAVLQWVQREIHVLGLKFVSQMMVVPALIPYGGQTDSFFEFRNLALLSATEMAWLWNVFIRDYDCIVPQSVCFPYKGEGLKDYPPAVMLVGSYDVVRDDAKMYARNLEEAGVYVKYIERPRTHVMITADKEGFREAALQFKELMSVH